MNMFKSLLSFSFFGLSVRGDYTDCSYFEVSNNAFMTDHCYSFADFGYLDYNYSFMVTCEDNDQILVSNYSGLGCSSDSLSMSTEYVIGDLWEEGNSIVSINCNLGDRSECILLSGVDNYYINLESAGIGTNDTTLLGQEDCSDTYDSSTTTFYFTDYCFDNVITGGTWMVNCTDGDEDDTTFNVHYYTDDECTTLSHTVTETEYDADCEDSYSIGYYTIQSYQCTSQNVVQNTEDGDDSGAAGHGAALFLLLPLLLPLLLSYVWTM